MPTGRGGQILIVLGTALRRIYQIFLSINIHEPEKDFQRSTENKIAFLFCNIPQTRRLNRALHVRLNC